MRIYCEQCDGGKEKKECTNCENVGYLEAEFFLSRQRKKRLLSERATEADIKSLIDESILYGINYTVDSVLATTAIVLRDRIKLSVERTKKSIKEIDDYFDSVLRGYVPMEQIREAAEVELGLVFNRGEKID